MKKKHTDEEIIQMVSEITKGAKIPDLRKAELTLLVMIAEQTMMDAEVKFLNSLTDEQKELYEDYMLSTKCYHDTYYERITKYKR